jgi:hypothetical protein
MWQTRHGLRIRRTTYYGRRSGRTFPLFSLFTVAWAVLGVDKTTLVERESRTTTTELGKDSTEKKEREKWVGEWTPGAAQERRSGRAHLGG